MDSNVWLNFWEFAEYVAEGVVIIGAVGETVADFTNWVRPRARRKLLARASAVVLIVGLAAGVLATATANHISNQNIAALNLQSASALQQAASATMEAGRLGVRVGNVSEYVTQKSGELDKTISSLDSARRKGDAKLTALAAQEAPRHLSKTQQDGLKTVLTPFAGQRIIVVADGPDEAKKYAQEIAVALRAAQWDVPDPGSEMETGVTTGIHLLFPGTWAQVHTNKAGGALVDALHRLKLVEKGWNPEPLGEKAPPDAIRLVVGSKPVQ